MRKFPLLCLTFVSALAFGQQAFAFTETVPVEKWVPTAQTFKLVGIGSRQFMPYMTGDAARTWALQSLEDGHVLRFELRNGDVNPYDYSIVRMDKERTEVGSIQRFTEGTPIHVSYKIKIAPGAGAESWWGTVIGQMHQDGAVGSPPMAFHLDKNNNLAVALTNNRTPGTKQNIALLKRDQEYKIDLFLRGGSQGEVIVFIDGKQAFAFSGIVGQASGGMYWKLGLYRAKSTPTMVVTYRDLKIESDDMVTMGVLDKLPAPTIRINRTGFITDVAINKVPQGAPVMLFDNGRLLSQSVGSTFKSATLKPQLAAGIHYLTAKYKDSATTDEVVIGVGTAQDMLAKFDVLTNAKGISGILLTDTHAIEVPATTDMPAFVAKNRAAINVIAGGCEFVKYALNRTRLDFYNTEGVKIRTEKR